MLSNVELILMRFIKIKPSYAYELEKLIEEKQLRHWVKIGGTTIYQVLDRLARKGLLDYREEKTGSMPARKRYFITSEGDEMLLGSVKEILQGFEPYYFDLSIGLACRQFLSDEEFSELIQTRLEKLDLFIDGFNEVFDKSRELYPTRRMVLRKYLLAHYRLEQEFLHKILASYKS